jgi:hypothetical protein
VLARPSTEPPIVERADSQLMKKSWIEPEVEARLELERARASASTIAGRRSAPSR